MTRSCPRLVLRGTHAGAAMMALALTLAALGLAACGGTKPEAPTPVPLPSSATPTLAPSPSPSATPLPATSFASDGELISGWYWLRDSLHKQSALWSFQMLPSAPGDIVLHIQVLATDRTDGPRGIEAQFYLAWATPAAAAEGARRQMQRLAVLPAPEVVEDAGAATRARPRCHEWCERLRVGAVVQAGRRETKIQLP